MNSIDWLLSVGKLLRGTAVILLPSLLFLLLFQQMKAAPTAVHAIIAVNTTVDELNSDGDCSLREAIQSANTNDKIDGCTFSGSGDLVVSVPVGSYFITLGSAGEDANAGGDFDLLASMTIQGAGVGSTVLDANLFDRLFDIDPAHSTSISVTILGMTLQNGRPPLGSNGGGIRNFDNTLTVQESFISDGRLTGNSTLLAHGGGIFSGGGFSAGLGVVLIISTTIEDNSSTFGSGGGIYNDGGLLNVSGSTIIGNSAQIISRRRDCRRRPRVDAGGQGVLERGPGNDGRGGDVPLPRAAERTAAAAAVGPTHETDIRILQTAHSDPLHEW